MEDSAAASETGSGRLRLLTWKCRRGMKELDILLEKFLAGNRNALAEGQWPEFEALLALEDDILWDCIRSPDDPEFAQFSSLIRAITLNPHRGA